MNWLYSIVRIAGASFPGAASLVQLTSEMETIALAERVRRLEDPISFLHDDVPAVARAVYQGLEQRNRDSLSPALQFEYSFYERYGRALAILESEGLVEGLHVVSRRYHRGIGITDPTFIMYACALAADDDKMSQLVNEVDSCKADQVIDGDALSEALDLPRLVVDAVFRIYDARGLGMRSREVRHRQYRGIA